MAPHTHTHIPTEKLNNGTLYAPRYKEAFWPTGKKQPLSLRSLGLASLLVERLIRKGVTSYLQQAVYVQTKTKSEKNKVRPTRNTSRNSPQPGDRDHFEAACEKTCPSRSPTLARFHRSQVCGNWPRTPLALSKNDECYIHTHTHRLIF